MLQRGQDQRPGRFDAPDHLDHQVDVVPGYQTCCVGGEQPRIDAGPVPAGPAYGDPHQLQRAADPRPQVVGLLDDQPRDL